jgi:hypothetical protein
MAHYYFLKDLEESKVAVCIVRQYLKEVHNGVNNLEITELQRARQNEGDLEIKSSCGLSYCVEVKYDIMAKKTGNLCFETHNAKGKLAGIFSTEAEEIHYVVPSDSGFSLYTFKTESLRTYLYNEDNISKFKVIKGGDRRATSMILVSIETLTEDKVPHSTEEINAQL